jgi:hypothetical protein
MYLTDLKLQSHVLVLMASILVFTNEKNSFQICVLNRCYQRPEHPPSTDMCTLELDVRLFEDGGSSKYLRRGRWQSCQRC